MTIRLGFNSTADGLPVAVVLGGQRNGLGIVRSLAQAGIYSVIVNTSRDVATVSRHGREFLVPSFDGESFVEELLRLREGIPQGGVLICAADAPLLTLSRYRDRLAPFFDFQELPPHELLVDLARKDWFFEMAQQGGFPVPLTLLARSREDLQGLRDLRPPLCVKPNGRSQAYDTVFKKAYRVESQEEAYALCERMLDVAEVIVQEWIEGSNDSIYFSLCCLGGPGPICFTGRKGRSWPPQIGYTASCWAAPEVAKELESLTLRFFEYAGITSGLASMEFKQDRRDGRFLMVEPTAGRANSQQEISALCGINLCHVAYCDAAKLPRPPLRLDPTHVWRNEFTDLVAAHKLGLSCAYPLGQRVHNAHWRWDDPAPALMAAAGYAKRLLKRASS